VHREGRLAANVRDASETERSAGPVWSRPVVLIGLAMVIVGVAVRVLLFRHVDGDGADLLAEQAIVVGVVHHFFHAYQARLPVGGRHLAAWTYPAGLFPVLVVEHFLARTGIDFRVWVAVPNVVADIGIALAVFLHLARTRGSRVALVGAGLVLLGWPFAFDTGVFNQADSLTTLVAVGAVLIFNREGGRRWLWAGLCMGLATSFKLPFRFFVFAFLPTCRGWRECVKVVAVTAAVPLLLTGPFLLADFHDVHRAITSNHGLPGIAGWTLLIEPALRHIWLDRQSTAVSSTVTSISAHQPTIVLVVLVLVGAVLWRFKTAPIQAAAVVSLALWLSNVNPNLTYLVWLMPFLLLDGRIVEAASIQLAGALPALLFVLSPHPPVEGLYVPFVIVLEATILVVFALFLRRVISAPDRKLVPQLS
jgi:Glycosyltransferase family 87